MRDFDEAMLQDLRYGIIYMFGNPKQMVHFDWLKSLIEPIIQPMKLQWYHANVPDILVVARRINVGNLGRYATCQLWLPERSDSYSMLAAWHTFIDCVADIADPSEGDVVINDINYSDRHALPEGRWGRSMEFSITPATRYRLEDHLEDRDSGCEPQDHTRVVKEKAQRPIDKAEWERRQEQRDEEREERAIEDERKRQFDDIKAQILNYISTYHDDPQALMNRLLEGKVILNNDGTPGRLLVNGDLKVVLPDYDEMEVKMTAMCRTVYILFLKLKATGNQGMRMADMGQYRDELLDIYTLVKPAADYDRVQASVDNLCNPMSNALNETISKINRYIKKVILDKQMAQQYVIDGTRGELYSVALAPDLITLPRAVLMDA